MSYEEIINRTDYTETELINLALVTAICFYKNCRNNADDFESWEHYDNLCIAFKAIKNKNCRNNSDDSEREKVIKTLESYATNPLHRKDDKYVISLDVRFVNTIIELLKEQEGVEPIGGEDDD